MEIKLKIHAFLLYFNAIIALAGMTFGTICVVGIHYGTLSDTLLIVIAISQYIIAIYAAIMAVRYEDSISRIKAKAKRN